MSKRPNAMDWPVKDMMNAVALITDLTEAIAMTTLATLMTGKEPPSMDSPEGWAEAAEKFINASTQDELDHHATTVTTLNEVALGMLGGYRNSLVEVGLAEAPMPSPDDITVPDSVEEIDW